MTTAVFKRRDLGVIDFGRYQGVPWSRVPSSYLRFLISPDCNTTVERKRLARFELEQRRITDGQMPLFAELTQRGE